VKRIQLEIQGMHCGHCLEAVREALAAVPGAIVEDIRIGSATVTVDDQRTGLSALIDAVYDAGYEAQESAA
jgi:copper chaperone